MKKLLSLFVVLIISSGYSNASNCMEFLLENGDSICIGFEKDESNTIIENIDLSVFPEFEIIKESQGDKLNESEFIYTLKKIPLHFKVVSSNLSTPYNLECMDVITTSPGYVSCNGGLSTNIIPIKNPGGWEKVDIGNTYKLYIKYGDGKEIKTEYTVDEEGNILYKHGGRMEYATGDFDIVFKSYKTYGGAVRDKDTYIKFNKILYSTDGNNWIDITNNRKEYFYFPSNGNLVINNGVMYKYEDPGENGDDINRKNYYWNSPLDTLIPTNGFIYNKAGYYKFKAHFVPKFDRDPGTSETWESDKEISIYVPGVVKNSSSQNQTIKQDADNSKTEDSTDKKIYSDEFEQAYEWAYKNGITTIKTIKEADLESGLTRIAMAKMLSNYAINVLGKKPANLIVPRFPDITQKLNEDYGGAVDLAYQLGIMGIGTNKFRPYDPVTRAEFSTALSRMLYGLEDGTDNYYSTHINKLYQEGIISNNNPNLQELRGYVMLMLMRSSKVEEDLPICTEEYEPVCGKNGKKYGNKCFMEIDGVEESLSAKIVNDECVYN